MFVFGSVIAGLAGFNWLLLESVQLLIIPTAPGGAAGPWVLRPIAAFHFGAMAITTVLSLPLVLLPLQRQWRRDDVVAGTQYDPLRNQPMKRTRIMIAGFALLIVYSMSVLFYLFSWTTIGPPGITTYLSWGSENYVFDDVQSLESIPDGMRSDQLVRNGPWYKITLRGGREVELSLDNEGLTAGNLKAITTFVADQSERVWTVRPDARPR